MTFSREFEERKNAFSAGRKWLCIQLLSKPKEGEKDGLETILRVRIPPARDRILSESFKENENTGFFRERSNARILREHVKSVRIPTIYHISPWGSPNAEKAGYPFMLMECVGGNKLKDVLRCKGIASFSNLSTAIQDHIMSQWAAAVVDLSTLRSNYIGPLATQLPISGITSHIWWGNPAILYWSTDSQHFDRPLEYFRSGLNQRIEKLNTARVEQYGYYHTDVTAEFLGVLLFMDICRQHFENGHETPLVGLPVVHRTLTERNILMDDEFNFVGLVDMKDALILPQELQESHVWDCWTSDDSKAKYHSMLLRAEENARKKGHEVCFPLSAVTDNKLKTGFKLYNNLGVNPPNDPAIVMKLLDLVRKPDPYDPMHYLAAAVANHWSCFYGIAAAWAHDGETGRMAFEAAVRAMGL
ncbi:unnamed protein product [Clonostachys solani]|uniref:Aminoglycoside phosphotransferase domain-containing protein n=1 Tax=Clonostachys solani TaxID=160281 RepID=A0A9N9ZKP6_9HYPO|nr:unnamed protein product [Clonostachys solani]